MSLIPCFESPVRHALYNYLPMFKLCRLPVRFLFLTVFFGTLLAGVFAVFAVAIWLWVLSYQGNLPLRHQLGLTQWHAHEMLFGYGMAVIAGFLLTAERNWTGIQTLHGAPLIMLATLWIVARSMPFIPYDHNLLVMAIADVSFDALLSIALIYPILRMRQWQHIGILFMVLMLLLANVIFYLDLFHQLDGGIHVGLYLALYMIVSLIMLMGRRVIPSFIENGVDNSFRSKNYLWLDRVSHVLMILFLLFEVLLTLPDYAAITAMALALLHAWRLQGWYTHGIWKKPLLWSLFLGYAWLVAGFVLNAFAHREMLNPMLAVHAFTYGTIGMITLSMMARVSLGHTGRDVFHPPGVLGWLFLLFQLGTLARVVMPMLTSGKYAMWIMVSQWLWIVTFAGFVLLYAPMLVKGRIDGKYG